MRDAHKSVGSKDIEIFQKHTQNQLTGTVHAMISFRYTFIRGWIMAVAR